MEVRSYSRAFVRILTGRRSIHARVTADPSGREEHYYNKASLQMGLPSPSGRCKDSPSLTIVARLFRSSWSSAPWGIPWTYGKQSILGSEISNGEHHGPSPHLFLSDSHQLCRSDQHPFPPSSLHLVLPPVHPPFLPDPPPSPFLNLPPFCHAFISRHLSTLLVCPPPFPPCTNPRLALTLGRSPPPLTLVSPSQKLLSPRTPTSNAFLNGPRPRVPSATAPAKSPRP